MHWEPVIKPASLVKGDTIRVSPRITESFRQYYTGEPEITGRDLTVRNVSISTSGTIVCIYTDDDLHQLWVYPDGTDLEESIPAVPIFEKKVGNEQEKNFSSEDYLLIALSE
jgi:hypothetical protein